MLFSTPEALGVLFIFLVIWESEECLKIFMEENTRL